jgi:hypothetical protein
MLIEVSIGEVLDKVSILKIKTERIKDKVKLRNVIKEYNILTKEVECFLADDLFLGLHQINEKLWDIEDAIRVKEKTNEYDEEFIALARSVYITNDMRFNLKNKINEKFNSEIREEKSYENY